MHPRGDLSEQGTRFVRPVNKNLQFEQRNTAFADDMIECTVMPRPCAPADRCLSQWVTGALAARHPELPMRMYGHHKRCGPHSRAARRSVRAQQLISSGPLATPRRAA